MQVSRTVKYIVFLLVWRKKTDVLLNLNILLLRYFPLKESSRYEESASVLYEKLIDKHHNNCFYIINKDNPIIKTLPPKYKKNLLRYFPFLKSKILYIIRPWYKLL